MILNSLLEKIGIDKKQQILLIRIIALSVTVCFLIVIGVIILDTVKHKPQHDKSITLPAGIDHGGNKGEPDAKLLPIDIKAHEWMAQYLLRIDQPQDAIEHLTRISLLKQNDRSFNLMLATACINAMRYNDALDLLQQLAGHNTRDSLSDSIESRLGLALYYTGKIQASLTQLEECMKKFPASREAPCYLGEVKGAVNAASPEALEYLKLAISRDAEYTEAWYQLARLHMARGEYETARTSLLQVLAFEPLNVRAHSRLGMSYYYLNQPSLALQSYQTALTLNPGDFNTRYNLGELYYNTLGDPGAALVEYKKALAEQPAHVEANFKVGLICLSNNMIKEAVQHFETARNGSPNNTRILLQLGVSYERLGLTQEAVATYRSILRYDDLNPIALQKLRLLKATGTVAANAGSEHHDEHSVQIETPAEHHEPKKHDGATHH